MIIENDPSMQKFIHIPKELQPLNCGVFMAGLVEAILRSNGYVPCLLFFSVIKLIL